MLIPIKTRSIDLPSDSTFAVAMRTQQQAEKAEQQRIKNLVLNYDLTDDQADGEAPAFHYVQSSKNNVRLVGTGTLNKSLQKRGQSQHSTKSDEEYSSPHDSVIEEAQQPPPDSLADETGNFETLHGGPRYDKAGNSRQKQRARKLQLGDIDWYDKKHSTSLSATSPSQRPEGQHSLDEYVVDKKQSTRGRGSGPSRRGRGRGRGGARNKG